MRRIIPVLSAVVFLVTVTAVVRSETQPVGITSLLGKPLTAPAIAPEARARMESSW